MAESDPLVVIVAYRNTGSLEAAVGSLGPGHPLLVVDNGGDKEVQTLVEDYGGRYVNPGRNVGFAAAVNIALADRDGRDVLLLNPDARVSPELPRALKAVLDDDPRVAAVAPRLVDAKGHPQRVEWPIPSPRQEWINALKLGRLLPSADVFFVGAVLLLRGEALEDVGAFDERFFLYAEECDWQLRVLRRGWRLKLAENVEAQHGGGGSSELESVRQMYFRSSAALFGRKWYGRSGWATMRAGSLLGSLLRLVVSLSRPSQRSRYARQLRL
jgi:GT2 family glycosyltransferase